MRLHCKTKGNNINKKAADGDEVRQPLSVCHFLLKCPLLTLTPSQSKMTPPHDDPKIPR